MTHAADRERAGRGGMTVEERAVGRVRARVVRPNAEVAS